MIVWLLASVVAHENLHGRQQLENGLSAAVNLLNEFNSSWETRNGCLRETTQIRVEALILFHQILLFIQGNRIFVNEILRNV